VAPKSSRPRCQAPSRRTGQFAAPSLAANFNITFNGNGGNNVDEIRRVLREEVHKAFRGVYADAGMRFA